MQTNYNDSQLLKGILEGCILIIISNNETYGYEILQRLHDYGFGSQTEGTLYPLLLRLEKKGMITATVKASPLGPRRKYFNLSSEGELYLKGFVSSWGQTSEKVNSLIKREVLNNEDSKTKSNERGDL